MSLDDAPAARPDGGIEALSFASGGVPIPALLHRATPTGSADLVIYLHGNPGGPVDRASAVADALTLHGIDVLQFNYRGTWGNAGAFNVTNSIADLRAAIDFVVEVREQHGLRPYRTYLLGYSYGTAVVLLTAMDDERIAGVASLATCDHGYFGRELLDPDSKVRAWLVGLGAELFGEAGPIRQDPALFVDDLTRNHERYTFAPRAAALVGRRLLFLTALDDEVCPPEDHFLPLYRALRRLGHSDVEAEVLTTDHGFSGFGAAINQRVAAWVVAGRGPDPSARRVRIGPTKTAAPPRPVLITHGETTSWTRPPPRPR